MSDLDRNYASPFGRAATRADAATVDAGLRAYMLRIYNYMAIGLAITGFAALGVYMGAVTDGAAGAAGRDRQHLPDVVRRGDVRQPAEVAVHPRPAGDGVRHLLRHQPAPPATAQLLFWAFAALMGISLSSIFLVYTHTSIVRVFFITAASFGALSLYGYTTKRDLTGMGSFLIMGLFGVIIASLVNLFLASSMLQFIVSVVGVLVFAGLTAWDTQRLKNEYIYGYAGEGDDGGALGDHRRTVAVPELHQPVHAADAVARPARIIRQADHRSRPSPGRKAGAFVLARPMRLGFDRHASRSYQRPRRRPTFPPSPRSTRTPSAPAPRPSSSIRRTLPR